MQRPGLLVKTIPVVLSALRPVTDFLFTFSACAERFAIGIPADHQYLLFLTG
ncbi:MAG: hypothetical protein ACYDDV_06740 [Methanoregula sp.]